MKKLTSILLVAFIFLSTPITGFAVESQNEKSLATLSTSNRFDYCAELSKQGKIKLVDSYSYNQYDYYMNMKQKTERELRAEGVSTNDIITVKSNAFESELLNRAQLPESELIDLGYTQDQIRLLKSYDGSPLENNPQMRAVTATFSGALYQDIVSKTASTTIFTWNWSSAPIVCSIDIDDYVGCSWSGTNKQNLNCQMQVYGKSCIVNYADGSMASLAVTEKDAYRWVQAKVRQRTVYSWAKSGSLSVQTREVVNTNGNLYSTLYYYGFGHSTLVLNGGISLSPSGPSLGLTFGTQVQNMFHKSITVRH